MQKRNQKHTKLNIGIIIILSVLMSVSLAGCKKENDKHVENPSDKAQTAVTTSVKEEEPVPLTLESWSASLTYNEPRLGVYNEVTSEGTIFEEGQQYKMQKEDRFILYVPVKYEGISFDSGPNVNENVENVGKCKIIDYEYKADSYDISITVNAASGEDYTMRVCLLTSDISISETTDANTTTIEEWIEELSETVKEPGIGVYNELTGDKTMLENGQEYQIKEGDKTFIYMAEDFVPSYMQPQGAKSYELEYLCVLFELDDEDKVDIEYELASGPDTIKLNATFIK